MKKQALWAMVLMLTLGLSGLAYACGGGQCSAGGKQCGMKKSYGGDCDKSQCPIANKIMKKSAFFLDNQLELGLSDEQVAQIKSIKLETEIASLRGESEMKIMELTINDMMSKPDFDADALKAMIDKGMPAWADGAKKMVDAYAKLKAVLTEDQMAKAKEIWLKK